MLVYQITPCQIPEEHTPFNSTALDNIFLITGISRMATLNGDAPLCRGTRIEQHRGKSINQSGSETKLKSVQRFL